MLQREVGFFEKIMLNGRNVLRFYEKCCLVPGPHDSLPDLHDMKHSLVLARNG